MNKLQQMWLVMRGRAEFFKVKPPTQIEVPVLGEAQLATLYCVNVPVEDGPTIIGHDGIKHYLERTATYYATCAEAHAANPGRSVYEVRAIRVGGKHFVGDVKSVTVQPKPKRPKGRVA